MSDYIVDLYPGQERWGIITKDYSGGHDGFITARWNTGRTTEIRARSVVDLAARRSGNRGYFRSPDREALACLLDRPGGRSRLVAAGLRSDEGGE